MTMPDPNLPTDAELSKMYESGTSLSALGRTYGISRQAMHRHVIAGGSVVQSRREASLPSTEHLVRLAHSGMTHAEIATNYGVSSDMITGRITRWRTQNGVPLGEPITKAHLLAASAARVPVPGLPAEDRDYRDRAACRGEDPEMWFAPAWTPEYARARIVCRSCPVIAQCRIDNERAESMESSRQFIHGIYGGETADERSRRRNAARKART